MYGVESFQNSLQMYAHFWISEVNCNIYYNIQVYEVVKNW